LQQRAGNGPRAKEPFSMPDEAQKSEPRPVSVYAVEDDARQLRALHKLLDGRPGLRWLGGAASGEQALAELPSIDVDVVLMDLELPGRDGVETTRLLRARSLRPEVLVLTSFEDEEHVFQAMRAGSSGYVVKGASGEKLARAIAEVDAGGTVIEPRLARRFWDWFKGVREESPPPGPELSAQEKDILFALAKGLSNAEVGRVVGLDRRTVRTALGHLYDKFGVRSHVELAVAALRLQVIEL
jgi:DNA-binding NarL/FixJ family response regulator